MYRLVFILIDDKLLLVPGHMIKIFLHYPIFNVYLNQINNIEHEYDIELIKQKYKLFDILIKNNMIILQDKFFLLDNKCFCNILLIILINNLSENINYLIIIKKLIKLLDLPQIFDKPFEINIIKKYFKDTTNLIFDKSSNQFRYTLSKILYHNAHYLLYQNNYNIKGGFFYIKYRLKKI